MDLETKKYLDRIYAKITFLTEKEKKATWISPSWLKKLTGWSAEEMRQAREQRIIEYKASEGGGWLYKLESVPEQFIVKQTVS